MFSRLLVQYLQKGDDKRSKWEVGRFLQFGVEFLNGESGVLQGERKKDGARMNTCGKHYVIILLIGGKTISC